MAYLEIFFILKGIFQPFELGDETRLTGPAVINWRPVKFFLIFNDKVSREEHKTMFSGLRISEMTLSNQSHFLGFFLSPESHLMGFADGLLSSGVTKSQKMTCRGLANSGLRQAGIGQAPVSHLPASPNHGR